MVCICYNPDKLPESYKPYFEIAHIYWYCFTNFLEKNVYVLTDDNKKFLLTYEDFLKCFTAAPRRKRTHQSNKYKPHELKWGLF